MRPVNWIKRSSTRRSETANSEWQRPYFRCQICGGEQFFALKLSFDSRLIYNRPYLYNLFSAKFIYCILGKGNFLTVYMEAKELSLWRTVEAYPARYIRRIGNQHLNVEIKVRNFIKVSLQHFEITITRPADRCGSLHHERTVPASASPA